MLFFLVSRSTEVEVAMRRVSSYLKQYALEFGLVTVIP